MKFTSQSLSHDLNKQYLNYQINEELLNTSEQSQEFCMFCGGDHDGSWCMAIDDDIAYFDHTYSI